MPRKKPYGEIYDKLVEEYNQATHQGKIELAKHHNTTYATLKGWVSEGASAPQYSQPSLVVEVPKIQSLPPINITPLPPEHTDEGEETEVVLISDLQAGQQSVSYNSKILKQRMEILSQKTLRLCRLHRRMRPIKKLVVCLLGDIVENMNIPIPKIEELEKVVFDQIFEVAVPALNDFLVSQLQMFETIEVYAVRGNHGQLEGRRSMSAKTNWDSFVYKILELGLKNFERIKFKIELDNFYQVVNIAGIKVLLVHGDQIQSYLGLPFYGIDRRTLRWNINIPGGWQYCFMGHFHICNYIRPSGIPVFINGTFASGMSYPLHRMGLQDDPRQWILFLSPKRGVTAMYDVELEKL